MDGLGTVLLLVDFSGPTFPVSPGTFPGQTSIVGAGVLRPGGGAGGQAQRQRERRGKCEEYERKDRTSANGCVGHAGELYPGAAQRGMSGGGGFPRIGQSLRRGSEGVKGLSRKVFAVDRPSNESRSVGALVGVARLVNAILTATYWEIGRRIVEQELAGKAEAGYDEELLARLARDLMARFGRGFSVQEFYKMGGFHFSWEILPTPSGKSDARTWRRDAGVAPVRGGPLPKDFPEAVENPVPLAKICESLKEAVP